MNSNFTTVRRAIRNLWFSLQSEQVRVFQRMFIGFSLVLLGWSIMSPPMATPDEPDHIVYAQGVWRFDFDAPYLVPNVPGDRVRCYAFDASISVRCAQGGWGDEVTELGSSAVGYPPVYYAIVGWAHHLFDGEWRGYGIRWASLLIVSSFVALAATHLVKATIESPRSVLTDPEDQFIRPLITVLLSAMPPAMTMYLSSVNPSSLYYASMLSFVLSIASIRVKSLAKISDVMLASLFITVFLAVRRDSIIWIWPALFIFMLFASRPVLVLFRARPISLLSLAPPTLAFFYQVVSGSGGLAREGVDGAVASRGSGSFLGWIQSQIPVASWITGQIPGYFTQVVGVWGWLDTSLPSGLNFLLVGFYVGLIFTTVFFSRDSGFVALFGIACFTLFPILLLAFLGFAHYQGRYAAAVLPLLFLGPLVVIKTSSIQKFAKTYASSGLFFAMGGFHFISQWQFLRRNALGTAGSWNVFSPREWTPILGVPLSLAATIIGFLVLRLGRLGRLKALGLIRISARRPRRRCDRRLDTPNCL